MEPPQTVDARQIANRWQTVRTDKIIPVHRNDHRLGFERNPRVSSVHHMPDIDGMGFYQLSIRAIFQRKLSYYLEGMHVQLTRSIRPSKHDHVTATPPELHGKFISVRLYPTDIRRELRRNNTDSTLQHILNGDIFHAVQAQGKSAVPVFSASRCPNRSVVAQLLF